MPRPAPTSPPSARSTCGLRDAAGSRPRRRPAGRRVLDRRSVHRHRHAGRQARRPRAADSLPHRRHPGPVPGPRRRTARVPGDRRRIRGRPRRAPGRPGHGRALRRRPRTSGVLPALRLHPRLHPRHRRHLRRPGRGPDGPHPARRPTRCPAVPPTTPHPSASSRPVRGRRYRQSWQAGQEGKITFADAVLARLRTRGTVGPISTTAERKPVEVRHGRATVNEQPCSARAVGESDP